MACARRSTRRPPQPVRADGSASEKRELCTSRIRSDSNDRLHIGPDPERGFRIEGSAWLSLTLETRTAREPSGIHGRFTRMVAGGRFATDETGRGPVVPYRLRG